MAEKSSYIRKHDWCEFEMATAYSRFIHQRLQHLVAFTSSHQTWNNY
ncbi:MAG: hypothetical protein ACFFGP_16250 [Promethearchaeota archaeon]